MKSYGAILAVLGVLVCFTLVATDDVQAAANDEAAVLEVISNLQKYISAGEWGKWLDLCSDDVVLTAGTENVSKETMRKYVKKAGPWPITDLTILKQEISSDTAVVSTSAFGNGEKYFETYTLKKTNGKWLIVKETNP